MKYHVGSRGEVSQCRASVKPCPLGGEHFSSVEAAEKYLSQLFTIGPITRPITGDGLDFSSYGVECQNFLSVLSPNEYSAVGDYVNQDYSQVNESLWNGENHALVSVLDSALGKGSSVEKTLFRRPVVNDKSFVGGLEVGQVLENPGFASTSLNPNAMIPLLHGEVRGGGRFQDAALLDELDNTSKNVVYRMKTNLGRPVSSLSHMPQELELLLPRGLNFKIEKITKDSVFSSDLNLATGESGWPAKRRSTLVDVSIV